MAMVADRTRVGETLLSVVDKIADIALALPAAADDRTAPVRALSFTRHAVGSTREMPVQQGVFSAACVARGWTAGGLVCQIGPGLRGWSAVVRMVGSGGYDVVVVDTWDRLAPTEAGQMRVLALLREAGVRLLIARDGIDTGEQIGYYLAGSLLRAWDAVAVAR